MFTLIGTGTASVPIQCDRDPLPDSESLRAGSGNMSGYPDVYF